MEIIFSSVSTPEEVTQILDLQAKNHVSTVSPAVAQEQGFVTVKHNPLVLQRMNQVAPSVIAKDGDRVVGYAAEGVEILASTDHDYMTNYKPYIENHQLRPWLTTIVGDELTTF